MTKTLSPKITPEAAKRRTASLCAWGICGADLFHGPAPALTMYADVPLWCLRPNAAPRDTSGIADLVVCRTQDSVPVFGIAVDTAVPKDWPASLPKIHLRPLDFTEPDKDCAFVDSIAPTLTAEITKALSAVESKSVPKLSFLALKEFIHPTGKGIKDAAEEAGMITSGRINGFGHACGLFEKYIRTDEGPVRLLYTCPNCAPRIQECLAKGKGVPCGTLALAERQKRYSEGKPIDAVAESVCGERLRTMLDTPMAAYMGKDWPRFRDLHKEALRYLYLPCRKEDFMYGEVLQTIYQLRHKYLLVRDPKLWGFSVRMMDYILYALVVPDTPPKPPVRQPEPEPEDDPDLDFPDDFFDDEALDALLEEPVEKIPLAERLKSVQPPNVVLVRPTCFFTNLPLAMYYGAASYNARSTYPDWVYRTSFCGYNLDHSKERTYTFNSVSGWISKQRKSNDVFDPAKPALSEYTLLAYNILVEPIYPDPMDLDRARRMLQPAA